MKPSTRIAIAGLLSAAGALLTSFASEFGDPSEPAPVTPEPTTKPKKEKKAAAAAPADPTPETPETPAEPEPEKPAAPTPPADGISNPHYAKHRAMIEPYTTAEDATAETRSQVKEIIKKYSPNGGLKVMDAKHAAAFEKDMAALAY